MTKTEIRNNLVDAVVQARARADALTYTLHRLADPDMDGIVSDEYVAVRRALGIATRGIVRLARTRLAAWDAANPEVQSDQLKSAGLSFLV